MHEVITRVMDAESEARRILTAAASEAELILSEARQKTRALSVRIRRETRDEIDRIMTEAVRDARQEKQTRLAGVDADLETSFPLDPSRKEQAVLSALRCVCGLAPESKP